jgi:hypothetical protein
MDRLITLDDIRTLPESAYPMMVFSDGGSYFSVAIKQRTRGYYSHFSWLIGFNEIATQGMTFSIAPVSCLEKATAKFVYDPSWTGSEKSLIKSAILKDLELPWWKRLYDIPGVMAEFVGLPLQVPSLNFCSERGSYLKLVDPEYSLKAPTPTELNLWTKAHQTRYKVFGRYMPD